MVRYGHVAAGVAGGALADAETVELLSGACVSFVACATLHGGMLQSSRQTVHWRSGAPIAVIAGAHSLLDQAAGG